MKKGYEILFMIDPIVVQNLKKFEDKEYSCCLVTTSFINTDTNHYSKVNISKGWLSISCKEFTSESAQDIEFNRKSEESSSSLECVMVNVRSEERRILSRSGTRLPLPPWERQMTDRHVVIKYKSVVPCFLTDADSGFVNIVVSKCAPSPVSTNA